MRVLRGGAGGPTVLMLHGLGATADVWAGVAAHLPGAWTAPDLPGHGATAPLPAYTFAAVADAVADLVDPAGTVVLGHSFGGVVGLHLAARPGVIAVIGLGIKVVWSAEELARAAAMAQRPPMRFATREEAVERHLKVAGLTGLVAPATVEAGVVRDGDGWCTALDPTAFGVGEPGVSALVTASPVPVVLARGERDPMVAAEQLRAIVPDPVELPGLGHNAHVEDPAAVALLTCRQIPA
ncbi:alpha/beta fold hydrolase [Pseudonocardia sp. TRM90224]|uniref:alpha/beta fold hydrolase n=1 Tax=Pseudonocardia sp. TRM90224 TaxID=2812678 RepID=UPI001E50092D|nr:alpha/beta hydrolase [Pseudonocardia sp. TRM90224]